MATRIDRAVADRARRQHRVITRAELLALGMGDGAIRTRLRNGRLHREHAGVYGVGAPVDTQRGRVLAAVRALGTGAQASHLTGAGLIGTRPEEHGVVHVTTPIAQRTPSGVIAHRTRRPDTRPRTCDGIPCTSVERTLVDLAGAFGAREAARAWRTADARRMIVPRLVAAELELARPGTPIVRDLLEEHLAHGTPRTRGAFEDRAADLFRPPAVRRPEVNVDVVAEGRTYRADLLWRAERVVVELDSWTWHGTPEAHARDARRALDLQLAGWIVVHLTWDDVGRHGDDAVGRIARLLDARGRGRPPA